ncbi:MAG: ATP-binding cassette domain-containing protein, partial [Dehalococcoidia bacterium]|nr:ATP-binding cassette domain-containing protein [Dehalococcoidia bacterium]
LDVTIQRQIIELLAKLKEKHRMSVLFISHDLGLVGEIADHVVVMRGGTVREQGPVAGIFENPQDAYTKALLACRPSLGDQAARLMVIDDFIAGHAAQQVGKAKDPEAPVVLEVRALAKSFWLRQGVFGKREFKAVQDVNFKLRKGHTLGVVGESGSGKTTMGLTLLRLHEPTAGEVIFDGQNLLTMKAKARQVMRRRIQIVFQNPYASLNPRFTIGQTLVEPMAIHGIGQGLAEREHRARELLEKVGLDGSAFGKYPHEFSGGQRQRVAIARALMRDPLLILVDEPTASLDTTRGAQVVEALRDEVHGRHKACVMVTHDLEMAARADRVLEIRDGLLRVHGAPVV